MRLRKRIAVTSFCFAYVAAGGNLNAKTADPTRPLRLPRLREGDRPA